MNERKRPDKYSGYERVKTIYGDDGNLYWIYMKIVRENGEPHGHWAAAPHANDMSGGPDESKMFDITYAQARGFEPIAETNIGKLRRSLGKKLLPQQESYGKKRLSERKNNQPKGKESAKIREIIDILEAPRGLAKKYGYTLTPEYVDINHGGRWPITKLQYNRLKELGYGSTNESYGKKVMNKRRLNERYPDYDPKEWEPEDIELHKSIDWKARNYEEYEVPEDSFVSNVVCYRRGASPEYKRVEFHKFIRPNPIYPPYYAPAENPFGRVVGPMHDGRMHGKYGVHDRYEDQETYDMLSESYEDYGVDPDETVVYFFPQLDRDDMIFAKRFGLFFEEELSDEDTTAISGRFEDLADFAENYLDYQLVDGYLFDENGDEIWLNESLRRKSLKESDKSDIDELKTLIKRRKEIEDKIEKRGFKDSMRLKNEYDEIRSKIKAIRRKIDSDGLPRLTGMSKSDELLKESIPAKAKKEIAGWWKEVEAWNDKKKEFNISNDYNDVEGMHTAMFDMLDELKSRNKDLYEKGRKIYNKYSDVPIKKGKVREAYGDELDDEDGAPIVTGMDGHRYGMSSSKSVRDSDGFWTDYTAWIDLDEVGRVIFIFGDNELYDPSNESPDWECDTGENAQEWFDNYEGFDDEDDEDYYGESLNKSLTEADTLARNFKKDIKSRYKSWDAENDRKNSRRKEIRNMLANEPEDKVNTLVDIVEPKAKPFNYELPKHLETKDYPFYVTYYEQYPIYEPAEGGYYYAGADAVGSMGFNSKEEAQEFLDAEIKEEPGNWKRYNNGYREHNKYIGEDRYYIIEPRKSYLSGVKGWEPYS